MTRSMEKKQMWEWVRSTFMNRTQSAVGSPSSESIWLDENRRVDRIEPGAVNAAINFYKKGGTFALKPESSGTQEGDVARRQMKIASIEYAVDQLFTRAGY